jgi:hypothetical protein
MLQCRSMDLYLLGVVESLQNIPQMQSCSFKNVLCKLHMSVAGMVMTNIFRFQKIFVLMVYCVDMQVSEFVIIARSVCNFTGIIDFCWFCLCLFIKVHFLRFRSSGMLCCVG